MAELSTYFDAVNDVMAAWAQIMLQDLKANAAHKKLDNSGELIRGMRVAIIKASESTAGEIIFIMPAQGKFRDMTLRYKNKQPDVDALAEWVKSVGVGAFNYTPGYSTASQQPTQDEQARRIAWGIAISRVKKKKSLKGKNWFRGRLRGQLNQKLIEMLVEATGTASLQIITEDLQQALDTR